MITITAERGCDARYGGAYQFRNHAGTQLKVVCMDASVWLWRFLVSQTPEVGARCVNWERLDLGSAAAIDVPKRDNVYHIVMRE